MESRNIVAKLVRGKVVKIRSRMPDFQRTPRRDPESLRRAQQFTRGRTNLWSITYFSDCMDKKRQRSCQRFRETLIPPDANDAKATILEVDELWSFVMKKTHQAWMRDSFLPKDAKSWLHPSWELEVNKPAVVCGKPCLKQARTGHCYTDFWKACRAVIPEEQHTAVGKETGETAHVERWNNTTLATPCSLCPQNTLFFNIGNPA
jgi:insertion element IS1 protein InsB